MFLEVHVPYKIKIFVWITILNRLTCKDLLQAHRSSFAMSPGMCMMFFKAIESHSHLFLHGDMAQNLWSRLSGTIGFS